MPGSAFQPSIFLSEAELRDLLSQRPPIVVPLAFGSRAVGSSLDPLEWQKLRLVRADSPRWNWTSGQSMRKATLTADEFVERLQLRGLCVRVTTFPGRADDKPNYHVARDPRLWPYFARRRSSPSRAGFGTDSGTHSSTIGEV